MPIVRVLLLGCLLLGGCTSTRPASSRGGLFSFLRPNRFDRHGLEHGRWRTYYDSADTKPYTAGCFRHGRAVGTYRYYDPTGTLDHSERYGRNGFCEVTYWHPGGQVARRGHAQWTTGAKGARFFWFGPWVSFSEKGDTTALEKYVDGKQTTRLVYENGRRAKLETYDDAGRLRSNQRLP